MNEENKMTKLALGEQARPQPIRQGSQPAGKNKFKFFAPRNLARGQVSGGALSPLGGGVNYFILV